MMRGIRDRSAFSMLELMVVVSIIGILSTLALPQYRKYAANSRRTEAKIALSSVHALEVSYAVEHSSYTMCLSDIGYTPSTNEIYYSVGFIAGGDALSTTTTGIAAPDLCGPLGSSPCNEYGWDPEPPGTALGPCRIGAAGNGASYFTATATVSSRGGNQDWDLGFADAWATGGGGPPPTVIADSSISKTTFRTLAKGRILGGGLTDYWSMDHKKALVNELSGLASQ